MFGNRLEKTLVPRAWRGREDQIVRDVSFVRT
jgi:hypothetical protein